MFKHIQIPPSFSLIQKGKVSLLLKEEYKNLLLKQGIDDLKTFLKNSSQTSHYLKGRTPHPSIPLEGGKRIVFRRYSHGGLLRAITGNLYLFGARSFRELALTEEIRSSGIPTIPSIGAIHRSKFSLLDRIEIVNPVRKPRCSLRGMSPSWAEPGPEGAAGLSNGVNFFLF